MTEQATINVGLIGQSISNSVSPLIHRGFFRSCGINGEYSLWQLPDARMLASFVDKVRRRSIRGFNVTMPYKLSIIDYLDELDELARLTGSVNVVVNDNGWLKGYNTDVEGVEHLIRNNRLEIGGQVALLGCGGAARAAAVALIQYDCQLFSVVRDLKSINVAHMRNICDRIGVVQEQNCGRVLESCGIIVNGLPPVGAKEFISHHAAIVNSKSYEIIIDLNYFPPVTDFVKGFCKAKKVVGGIDMLAGQAMKAFSLWTGCVPVFTENSLPKYDERRL